MKFDYIDLQRFTKKLGNLLAPYEGDPYLRNLVLKDPARIQLLRPSVPHTPDATVLYTLTLDQGSCFGFDRDMDIGTLAVEQGKIAGEREYEAWSLMLRRSTHLKQPGTLPRALMQGVLIPSDQVLQERRQDSQRWCFGKRYTDLSDIIPTTMLLKSGYRPISSPR